MNSKLLNRIAAFHHRNDLECEEEKGSNEHGWLGFVLSLLIPVVVLKWYLEMVPEALAEPGFGGSPVFDMSYFGRYDIPDKGVVAWAGFVCGEGRLGSFFAVSPCTTFSLAFHSHLKPYSTSLDINLQHPRVGLGDALAPHCGRWLMNEERSKACGVPETSRRSEWGWTPKWKLFIKCLVRKCSRSHDHITYDGKYTQPSAAYWQGLACVLALAWSRRFEVIVGKGAYVSIALGLGDGVSYEVFLASTCQTKAAWRWIGTSFISAQETVVAPWAREAEALQRGDLFLVFPSVPNGAPCASAGGRCYSVNRDTNRAKVFCIIVRFEEVGSEMLAPLAPVLLQMDDLFH